MFVYVYDLHLQLYFQPLDVQHFMTFLTTPFHEYGLLKGLGIMFVLCEPRSGLSSLEKEILFGNHDFRFHFNFLGCSLFKDIFMMIFEILDFFGLFFPQHSS